MSTKIFGIGAAGNKCALKLLDLGICKKDDLVLVNSTRRDIPASYDGRLNIFNTTEGGCGKERSVGRDYAAHALKSGKFDDVVTDSDFSIILITSLEGGTGSGATPVIAKYFREVMGKNVHIIAFSGFNSDVRGLQNSVEFFQEIDFECDIQCIDLKEFNSASMGNHLKAEELADEEVAQRIKILLGQTILPSEQNIDEVDMLKLVNTTGYKTIEHIEFKEDLMDQNQFNALCKKMIYSSKSLKTNDPAELRLGVILNIKPASEDAIDYDFTVIKEAYGFPYETFFHKQYDGKSQFVEFICSGMKMPIEEIKQLHEKYKEQTAKVNKSADEFFAEIQTLNKDEGDSRFDMVKSSKKATMSKSDFFDSL